MAINAHVQGQAKGFELAMTMTIDMPTSVVAPWPYAHGVMANHDELLFDLNRVNIWRPARPKPIVM